MTSSKRRRLPPLRAAALAAALCILGACGGEPPSEVTVAEGVTFRTNKALGAQTLTVELAVAKVRPVVVAERLEHLRNNVVGDAHTVLDWARKYNAVAGVNAGFFGDSYDSLGRRKQVVQLCVLEGKVVAPGTPVGAALRSAIGFQGDGRAEVTWAVGSEQAGARRFDRPVKAKTGFTWHPESAVACGPRLIHRGKVDIADRAEKLVSDLRTGRMAVAVSERYLVFCRADAMTYGELSHYLMEYFKTTLQAIPDEALCLDGGPSAQLVYQEGGKLKEVEPTGVQVPTAILLIPTTTPTGQ
ncbi:phosphodiester glycosidase family protein [Armatimonas rosea]|uniref:Exopolysaccharide biosynthesis protein n=1 Tax=Armatimonas rosea TaxID=685828 RepID=A0A7W9SWP9_ARMRO|nr:phosphodiester glycosidase family protein [Armatimonas rosea]MBB6053383.1 exopolysaccharide biosynthesis protein [Armatimonas rosea]